MFLGERDPDYNPSDDNDESKKKEKTLSREEEVEYLMGWMDDRLKDLEEAERAETPVLDDFYMKRDKDELHAFQKENLEFASRMWDEYVLL